MCAWGALRGMRAVFGGASVVHCCVRCGLLLSGAAMAVEVLCEDNEWYEATVEAISEQAVTIYYVNDEVTEEIAHKDVPARLRKTAGSDAGLTVGLCGGVQGGGERWRRPHAAPGPIARRAMCDVPQASRSRCSLTASGLRPPSRVWSARR